MLTLPDTTLGFLIWSLILVVVVAIIYFLYQRMNQLDQRLRCLSRSQESLQSQLHHGIFMEHPQFPLGYREGEETGSLGSHSEAVNNAEVSPESVHSNFPGNSKSPGGCNSLPPDFKSMACDSMPGMCFRFPLSDIPPTPGMGLSPVMLQQIIGESSYPNENANVQVSEVPEVELEAVSPQEPETSSPPSQEPDVSAPPSHEEPEQVVHIQEIPYQEAEITEEEESSKARESPSSERNSLQTSETPKRPCPIIIKKRMLALD